MKRKISIVIAAALFFAGIFTYPPEQAHAITVEKTVTKYHLDIGAQHIWGTGSTPETAVYDKGDKGGPIDVSVSLSFPREVSNIRAYALTSSNFHWGETGYSFNQTDYLHNEGNYNYYYKPYASSSIYNINASSSGRTVNLSYKATLASSDDFDLKDRLNRPGGLEYIFDLLGGAESVEEHYPGVYDRLTEGAEHGIADNVYGFLYFTPVIIQYDVKEMVEIGDFEPGLDLPGSAKQGEEYTAADSTIVDDNIEIDYAVLEKHYGDGDWELADNWSGAGSPGENTGGSINESCDEICTITYRLTVYDTYGQSKSVAKTINITDGREIDAQAILELPAFTYEGHPALATDVSEFEVDGVNYSARRAYEEDVAENKFVPLPSVSGSAHRESPTTANVTFPVRGNYNVRLEVNTSDGNELTDTKPIEVRKTPAIIDNLGGFQKQNRKQILNVSVATYPGKPIVDYYVELTDLKTGQSITLTPSQPQQNNVTIKTRAITSSGDSYWTNFEILFLTKNTETQEYRYKIYMKDSKGDTDTVQKDFTVKPDLPPNPSITIQDSFIRNKGTNTAEIQAEDSSTTDGDQLQRTWTVKGINVQSLPGFKDNSFGSRQKIQYNKTGVGKDTINLFVKDVWVEPTLEEYITEADYLSASTTATAEVVNIAPTVRLEPIETETADIAIVTEKTSESGIKAGINSLKAALIEAGIDANVRIIPTAKPNNDGYKFIGDYEWKTAINDQTQNSTGLLFDSEYAYVIEAAGYQMSGYQEVAIRPYTVKAIKRSETGSGLVVVWSYTVTEPSSFRLCLDSSENYVYLACNDTGKTILLNRNNGAYVTTLPIVIPGNPYTTSGNNNLYFLSVGSIQKYDLDTGTLKTVLNKGGYLGRIQNGKITFVGSENSHKYYIGQFDMNNETVTQKSLPELQEYVTSEGKSAVSPTDMDTTGKVTFTQTLFSLNNNDNQGVVLWLADAETQRVYNLGNVVNLSDFRTNSVGFVKDESGKAMYMYHALHDSYRSNNKDRRWFYLYVWTLGDGDNPPVRRTIYAQDNGRNNSNGISYAKYHSQENAMYLMQGGVRQGADWGGSQMGVNARIQLPDWSVNLDQYAWGWDVADEEGTYNDHLMMTYFNWDEWINNHRRIKMFTNSITKDQAEESALTRLADFSEDATRYIEKSFSDITSLIDKVKEAVKEKTSLKFAVSDGGQISLSRSYNLKPGQTYYYEYEVKKPYKEGEESGAANVTAPQITYDTQNVYEGTGNLESYYVTNIIEEKFNGALNPFFTLDTGMITDSLQTPTTAKYGSSTQLATASQVSFTIPEGKTAVAVMDVEVYHDSLAASGWRSGAYINGQRYDSLPMNGNPTINGYVHPYLLKPGVNTITAYVCDYTRQLDSWYTKIDNIKIMFLEKNPSSGGSNFSSVKTADGWTKVTGSFKAPQKISEFQSQSMSHYPNWPPGLSTSVSGNYTYYDFAIPAGQTSKIHATFQGYTSRSDTTAGTFTFPGWSVRHRGTSNGNNLPNVGSGETYYTGNYQGAIRITAQAGYQRSISFSNLETFIYPENLRDKYSFFFTDGKVYSMSNTFDGKTNIKINLNSNGTSSELLMQNFKVYYLNNGNKVYLYNKPLQDTSELSGWTITENATAEMYTETKPEKEEDAPLIYKKGQLVSYNIFYDDYENDPSKKQYWRYIHTPYNDGPHPDAAFILDEDGNVVSSSGAILAESIPRFYIDGKYTVEHWQEDNTNRTGDTSGETDYTLYDKPSNIESITFYVEGGATAPWITSIKTIPGTIKEGDSYRLQIGVDDAEKDILRLTTELYKDKKLIYTHRQTGIVADASGNYPLTTTGYAPLAEAGKYEVVCTVRDWAGAGIGSYKFTVVSEGKITGFVNHTDQWNINRMKYNIGKSGTPETPRGYNVFWSGEKFMLRSEVAGSPTQVTAQILGYSYSTTMHSTGVKNAANEMIYSGEIWNADMINKWGRETPVTLTFRFTAYYSGGTTKTHDVNVIVDNRNDYFLLHRYF